MALTLQIDNRGTVEIPYGYVYLSDRVRAVYRSRDDGTMVVGFGSGGWNDPNERQRREAVEALAERYPGYEVRLAKPGERL